MLEFSVRCKPENVTVTCAISDCNVSAAFVHSLNDLLRSLLSFSECKNFSKQNSAYCHTEYSHTISARKIGQCYTGNEQNEN